MSRRGQGTVILLTGLVAVVVLSCETPTTQQVPLTMTTAPTIDFEALDATSAAISPPVATALAGLPDVQGITSVSALVFKSGVSLSIYAAIANADDNEDTMNRLLDAAKATVSGVIDQIHVTTTVDGIPQRVWLWEAGAWSWASAKP